jgi:hypothetical protein
MDGKGNFYKLMLNSSYGKDGMNTAKYPNTKIYNKYDTMLKQCRSDFISSRRISDDLHIVNMRKQFYYITTPIQCAVFTLDNAKYWYIKIIYDFIYQAFDTSRIHFCQGDTDSQFWGIAGDPSQNYHQKFDYVIKDVDFYNKYYPKWISSSENGRADEKKLLKYSLEKEGTHHIGLAPKSYYFWGPDDDKPKTVIKGLSQVRNPLTRENYMRLIMIDKKREELEMLEKIPEKTDDDKQKIVVLKELLNNAVEKGSNCGFMMKKVGDADEQLLSKVETHKYALTLKHNKVMYIFPPNQSCVPFIPGISPSDCVHVKN